MHENYVAPDAELLLQSQLAGDGRRTVLLVKVYICTYIDLAAGEVQDVLIVQL